MNDEELRATIEEIKAQVKAKPENAEKSEDEIDEMILDAFFKAYTEGEMSKEDLMGIAQAMGYEPTEAFEQDPEAPAQVEEGAEGAPAAAPEEGADEVTQEDLKEVRTIDEDEDVDEFKEKIEDVKEGKGGVEEEVDDEDEDAQRERASKLFKTDLTKKD